MPYAEAIIRRAMPVIEVRRPFATRLGAALALLIALAMFTLSGGVLWTLGINYDGITGSAATKIHIATYLTAMTFLLMLVFSRHPVVFAASALSRNPGAITFLVAALLLGAFIIIDGRRGIATVFDTYLVAGLVVLIVGELDLAGKRRIERLLHVLMTANALLALAETMLDVRFFPYRFDGESFDWDHRSTALLGHPLENAAATAVYTITLVSGGGRSLPSPLRLPVVLLQLGALVAFGGRSGLTITLAMIAYWGMTRLVHILRGGSASMSSVVYGALLLPVLAIAIGGLAAMGFFDLTFDRFFTDDGGSAQARLGMLDLLGQIPLSALLFGADPDLIASLQKAEGLEWGIENPIVRLVLYQGVAFTTFLVVGFVLFMRDIARRTRDGTLLPFLTFFVVINTSESISNKTLTLARFALLMLVMFPIEDDDEEPSPIRR